ncbi:Caspase domain protein [Stieleria varia]|uniref:Caspase domain protein n=2 Tax=Stieleria varia TaxID=2528005 RepID=A0A5C6BAH2_9BACT|nr:Caspase domain protein [Stieleria varia]
MFLFCPGSLAIAQWIDLRSEASRLVNQENIHSGDAFAFERIAFENSQRVAVQAEMDVNYTQPFTGETTAYSASGTFGAWFLKHSPPILHDGSVAIRTMYGICLWNFRSGEEYLRLPISVSNPGGGATVNHSPVFVSLHTAKSSSSQSGDCVLAQWDLRTGELVGKTTVKEVRSFPIFATCNEASYVALTVHPQDADRNTEHLVMVDIATGETVQLGECRDDPDVIAINSQQHVAASMGGETWVYQKVDGTVRSTQLNHPTAARAMRFSRDGSRFATAHRGGQIVLWDTADYTPLRTWTLRDVEAGAFDFSENNRQLLISIDADVNSHVYSLILDCETGDSGFGFPLEYAHYVPGTSLVVGNGGYQATDGVQLWSAVKGKPVAQPILFSAQRHFAIKTTVGQYKASPEMFQFLKSHAQHVSTDGKLETLEALHQPKTVQFILAGVSPEIATQLPEDYSAPTASLRLVSSDKRSAKVEVSANVGGSGISLSQVSLSRLERPLPESVAPALSAKRPDPQIVDVPFPPGKNSMTLQATATDSLGVHSAAATLEIQRPEKVTELSGRLFVLAAGVSDHQFSEYNLDFPAKDAQAVAERFSKEEGLTFGEVHTQVYTDGEASLQNLKNGLTWLRQVCTPDDTAVLFFSGHGIKGRRGLYYVTHEGDAEAMQYTCLNWEDVAQTLSGVKARQVVFLCDACYAGGFAESQLATQKELAEGLSRVNDLLIFASSGPEELSREDPQWKHGAFTKSLLEALDGQADEDADQRLSLAEIVQYTTSRTRDLTDGSQNPFIASKGTYDEELCFATSMQRSAENTTNKPGVSISPLTDGK